MKKILLVSVILAICFSLVACTSIFGKDKLDGKYVCEIAGINFMTIEFDDGKVTRTSRSGNVTEGTYSFQDNVISVSWEDEKSDEFIYDEETDSFKIEGVDDMIWKKSK